MECKQNKNLEPPAQERVFVVSAFVTTCVCENCPLVFFLKTPKLLTIDHLNILRNV